MAKANSTTTKLIFAEADEALTAYEDNPIELAENLNFLQYKVIKMCEFYANSRYLKGNRDTLGREKPFYNIVNFRVTVAKVATSLDVKDVQIEADLPKDWVRSMFLNHEAYEWMKKTDFASFLKEATHTRAKYGGVLVKKTQNKKDGLRIDVCDWRNIVCDQVDTLGGLIIETHHLTPVELSKKKGVWDNVDDALKLATNKRMTRKRGYTQEQYNSVRIEVREIWGELPMSVYKDAKGDPKNPVTEEDKYTYKLQHYFISDIAEQQFIFLADLATELPYDYVPWEKMVGRGLGRGVIEDSEEAQIWTNDAVIGEKHAMDLAGKVVVKTTSKKLGNNILTVDNGKIFEIEKDAILESLTLNPAALGEFENQIKRWQEQADYATSSFDANTGANPPADTPYSQTALLNQVASKPFDYRREEMGIFVTRLFTNWVIPFLINQLYKGHTLASDYTEDELKIIDESFAVSKANGTVIKKMLSLNLADMLAGKAKVPTPDEYAGSIQGEQSKLRGKTRHIKFPTGYFDDFESKVTVVTSNEMKNKQAVMQSLTTVLQTVTQSYNPQTGQFMILQNPIMAKIFGSILEMAGTGLSPTNLGLSVQNQTPSAPAIPNATPATPTPPVPAPAAPTPVQTPTPAVK